MLAGTSRCVLKSTPSWFGDGVDHSKAAVEAVKQHVPSTGRCSYARKDGLNRRAAIKSETGANNLSPRTAIVPSNISVVSTYPYGLYAGTGVQPD